MASAARRRITSMKREFKLDGCCCCCWRLAENWLTSQQRRQEKI